MRPDYWSISRISSSVSSPGETVYCNPSIDTHNAMSELHIFTVPISGIYQISEFGETAIRSLKKGDILDPYKERREKLSILKEMGT